MTVFSPKSIQEYDSKIDKKKKEAIKQLIKTQGWHNELSATLYECTHVIVNKSVLKILCNRYNVEVKL